MLIKGKTKHDIRVVSLSDEFSAADVSAFWDHMNMQGFGGGHNFFVIDLEGVTGIDAKAVDALGGALRKAKERKGNLVLANLGELKSVFQTTGALGAFKVFDSVGGAVVKLKHAHDDS